MTQDIRIAHHAASGDEPVTRRATLEDKDQAEGFGARALAVLFIGFAVYLKSFFTASQAEDTTSGPGQAALAEAAQTETASPPAMTDPAVASAPGAKAQSDSKADAPAIGQGPEADLPLLVALDLPPARGEGAGAAIPDNPGTGGIGRDPALSDPDARLTGDVQQPVTMAGSPGPGLPSDAAASPAGDRTGSPVTGEDAGQDTGGDTGAADGGTPDAPQVYDIAALFQDMGVTLQDRSDSLVDRVTDLAIGDLMRDLTLDAFRAHLGAVPQDPGRPLDRLVSVLSDEGSREAFLARTGLMQDALLDASYGIDRYDPSHSHTGTEPDTGPDLFL